MHGVGQLQLIEQHATSMYLNQGLRAEVGVLESFENEAPKISGSGFVLTGEVSPEKSAKSGLVESPDCVPVKPARAESESSRRVSTSPRQRRQGARLETEAHWANLPKRTRIQFRSYMRT